MAFPVDDCYVHAAGYEGAGMDETEFLNWVAGAVKLTRLQRRQAFRSLAIAEALAPVDEERAEFVTTDPAVLELSPKTAAELSEHLAAPSAGGSSSDSVVEVGRRRVADMGCPHCANRDIVLWGKASGLPRYRCKGCGRTFNGLTKTPLARLRKKEKWQDQAQAMIDGVSVAKAAERCEVDYKTAFRWRHRFLEALSADKPKRLSGIVEGDETFILESFKGKKSGLPRKSRKRGGKAAKRGLSTEQIPVIVARDRSGATIDAVLSKLDRASIIGALGGIITPANQFCCDGGRAIVAFARKAGIPHHVLPAPGKPSPDAPDLHINNVNAYHGRLKEWMRRFHGVATKNLPNYLGWRRAMEAMGAEINPEGWILGAAGIGPYQQLAP
jgi:transposase-like protein